MVKHSQVGSSDILKDSQIDKSKIRQVDQMDLHSSFEKDGDLEKNSIQSSNHQLTVMDHTFA